MARRTTFAALTCITGLALAGLALVPAHAGSKSSSKVKVTAVATAPDAAGKQTVTITLVHDKGWHTYANPVDNKEVTGNETIVKIDAKVKPTSVKVDYPAGKLHEDKFVGNHRIYDEKLVIQATIQRAAGDASPLKVDVTINACDVKICLPRDTIPLTVP